MFKLADFKGKLKTFLPWVVAENKEIYKMVRSGQIYGQGHGHEKIKHFFSINFSIKIFFFQIFF